MSEMKQILLCKKTKKNPETDGYESQKAEIGV